MKKLIDLLKKIPFDKLLHYTIALILFMGVYRFCKDFNISTVISKTISIVVIIIICILKEVYDKKDYGLFDIKDIIAGEIGILTGVILM